MLDCFCGLGGASEGFHREGFDCTGIDIINVGYPYRFIEGDMNQLKGENYQGYDVIWGSPPCRDFSVLTSLGWKYWKVKPDPNNGLVLVRSFLKFIHNAKPRIWIMENVPRLENYLQLFSPKIRKAPIKGTMKRSFWGTFPSFLMPQQPRKILHENVSGKYRSWKRAKIPLTCSLAFAQACKSELEKSGV